MFTYELHHGALVSTIEYEIINGDYAVYRLNSQTRTVLIFALYVTSLNMHILKLKLYFDIKKLYALLGTTIVD